MIEIILLIFFTNKVGKIAESKGYNRTPYRILAIGFWILLELLGVMIGRTFFEGRIIIIYMFALLGAGLSAFVTYIYVDGLERRDVIK
jgi:hypothetical protein